VIVTATRQQFFTAVAAVSGMDLVYQGISAETNSSVWIEFNSAKYVEVNDPVYVSAQIALNYTSDQMLTLFEAAVQVPV
jgi:enamine deaminase RidA (YjgF/YER057c/UK114 family)